MAEKLGWGAIQACSNTVCDGESLIDGDGVPDGSGTRSKSFKSGFSSWKIGKSVSSSFTVARNGSTYEGDWRSAECTPSEQSLEASMTSRTSLAVVPHDYLLSDFNALGSMTT